MSKEKNEFKKAKEKLCYKKETAENLFPTQK